MEKLMLRVNQLFAVFLFFASWVLSWFYKNEKDLWLVAERETEARDNGYWMFKYIVEEHPEINVRYIIKKDSPDYKKLLPWKDLIVEASSYQHYMLMWKVKYCVGTHYHTYFPYRISRIQLLVDILKRINKQCKIIWLQHGVIKDDFPVLHKNKKNFDIFICGAKSEYDFVKSTFEYPDDIVKYTGLARFDLLHDVQVKKRQILVMPTWRLWLNETNFDESNYYLEFSRLLKNKRLHLLLEKYNLKIIFYPHFKCQKFISYFKNLNIPRNIVIADCVHYDVQQLLKTSALLITDYSSVFWDFAYMNKPHIYYQFDEDEFRKRHYSRGYYDYHNGLGEWTADLDDLISKIEKLAINDMNIYDKYKSQVNFHFPLRDQLNRERIFNEIIALS